MTRPVEYLETPPNWTPEERPTLPGSPATPYHRPPVRVAYMIVGLLVGITGGLGNALVTANLPQIQGELGLTPSEGAWLPAAYFMVNVSSNLILFKCRQQFGIRRFAEIGILAYVLVTVLHLLANDYATALFVRAASGFAAAPLTSLGFYYTLQAFPKRHIGAALCVGFTLSQLATPLAWLVSPPLLDIADWRGLYLFELGMALLSMAAVVVLKLPAGVRIRVFERRDLLTFALAAPAFACIAAVLSQWRVLWWNDQPWMAYALIAALLLLASVFFVEHHRRTPMIQTRWLGAAEVLRFAFGALMLRFLLSEQTFAVSGLMRTLGMGPDQLQPLYAVILAGTAIGALTSAALFAPKRLLWLLTTSVALIVVASRMDGDATSLTRPHDLFLSQFLMAMAGGMFVGPLLLTGMTRALAKGTDYVITFVVLFSMTQSLGGLLGPAVYSTFQQYREHEYSALLAADVDPTDPVVAQRLNTQSQLYARVVTDPVLRAAQGRAQLAQTATREANVRAYNDVVSLNATIALAFLGWSFFRIHVVRRQERAAARQSAAAGAA